MILSMPARPSLLTTIMHRSLAIALAVTVAFTSRVDAEEPTGESKQQSQQAEGTASDALSQSVSGLLRKRPPAGSSTKDSVQTTGGRVGRMGYVRTTVFGVPGEGSKFVYVFDRSLSMDEYGGRPLQAAKKELLRSLEDLGDVQQFYIVFYNQEPKIFNPGVRGRLTFATTANKLAAQDFVDGIRADGGTNHLDALKAALNLSPDVIFLLTDGTPEHDLNAEELREISRRNDGRASINVIQFADRPHDTTLKQLASENRGQHAFVDIAKLGR